MTENEAREILEVFDRERKEHMVNIPPVPYFDMVACDNFTQSLNIAIEALKEIQKYRSIGTVEECRAAVEKQMKKKPILCMNEQSGMFVDYADGHGEYKTQMNNWWRCPCCNEVVGQRVIAHKHIHDQRKKNYCEKCGQAIDWSDSP